MIGTIVDRLNARRNSQKVFDRRSILFDAHSTHIVNAHNRMFSWLQRRRSIFPEFVNRRLIPHCEVVFPTSVLLQLLGAFACVCPVNLQEDYRIVSDLRSLTWHFARSLRVASVVFSKHAVGWLDDRSNEQLDRRLNGRANNRTVGGTVGRSIEPCRRCSGRRKLCCGSQTSQYL